MGAYLNKAEVMQQLEWIVRILLAGACGGMIGYERESRKKSAGLRTHVIVAVSSALMTVLSKYGFQDVVGEFVRVDPARIAAGTVAAIGFLGSGIIFSRDKNVSGVTTSAGIWATLGVGMAMGAGLYIVGIITTAVVVMVEIFLGRQGKVSRVIKDVYEIEVEYINIPGSTVGERIQKELEQTYGCKILKFRVRQRGGCIQLGMLVRTSKGKELYRLADLVGEYPEIERISI
jgi:putative Mg2+ transporter-C (MgtC) family protein